MKLKRLFGTVLPFIGWREYEQEDVEEISQYVHGIDPSRRYSGFQIEWMAFLYGYGMKDIGPRE